MMPPVRRWEGTLPEVDLREVLRYAACRAPDEQVLALARSAADEGSQVLRPALCWRVVGVKVENGVVDLGFTRFPSEKLAAALEDCDRAVLFAATVGLGLDRLIARHGRLSPARGLMLQAYGAERVEALCDAFCDDLAAQYAPTGLVPHRRFSPGYGDLPLEAQRAFFDVLDCRRTIGLWLNESLLMSPSKSVTAIVGLSRRADCAPEGCTVCDRRETCDYRKM